MRRLPHLLALVPLLPLGCLLAQAPTPSPWYVVLDDGAAAKGP